MNILISNDDGVLAPGLKVLATTIEQLATVCVVAPDNNKSATSAALTLDRPLRVEQLESGYFSVNGTPCDCIHLGSHRIMKTKPDMVIAGINRGPNLGDDVIYSGTVAAAMEGRHLGFPSIAVSLAGQKCEHYQTAGHVMMTILSKINHQPLQSNVILNINVPDIPINELKGIKITRLGSRHRADNLLPTADPRGNQMYWIGPPAKPMDVGPGTDFAAIMEGFVSITPLVVDLTSLDSLKLLEPWVKDFNEA